MPLLLLIDDDDDARAVFCQALRRGGYEVAEAENGHEALGLLLAGLRPALILLDSDMPILDGAGFRSAQLDEPELARIPVLLVTADVAIEELVRTIRPIGIVQKPVGFQAFLSTVELVLLRLGLGHDDAPPMDHA